jgi:hypothetical protein
MLQMIEVLNAHVRNDNKINWKSTIDLKIQGQIQLQLNIINRSSNLRRNPTTTKHNQQLTL